MAETVTSKKKKKAVENAEMSFWDHLDALRRHLFRSAVAVLVGFVVAFLNKDLIFNKVILAPKETDFITNKAFCALGRYLNLESMCPGQLNLEIINLNISGQFTTHMMISFFAGLIIAFPYIIWEVWQFLKPALYEKERRYSRGAVFAISLLFIFGILFSYFLIVPLTLNFFGSYRVSEMVANQISLTSYISTILSVTLWMGIIFQLPVFVYFLSKVGIVSPEFLRRNRKFMIVIIVTIAAIITPPDIISQVLVSIPLLGLYELSIWISKKTVAAAD